MRFYKYHGLGNDFILVEDFDGNAPKGRDFVVRACGRHSGIGADGILYVQKKGGLFWMKLLNSDGSEAEMCGNGIRCVAKHLYDSKKVKSTSFEVGTPSGAKKLALTVSGGKVKSVLVDMGRPEFLGSAKVQGESLSLISMGNPHAIMFRKKIDMGEVAEKGPKIEKDKFFPKKTNVEFARVMNRGEIELVVFERGAGLTLACGTGACATVAAAAKAGLVHTGKPVLVHLPGGDLRITLIADLSKILMDGPAEFVFTGEIGVFA